MMSSIRFHTKDFDEVYVRGGERVGMSIMIDDISCGILRRGIRWNEGYYKENFKSHYSHNQNGLNYIDQLMTEFCIGRIQINHKDSSIRGFSLRLNTALLVGSDVVKLFCRIHAQCEIHCWVKNENLGWFSEIIKQGVDSGLMREDMGWNDVLDLAQKTTSDLVLSYSVTDWFAPVDEDGDETQDEVWDRCMVDLRESRGSLEMKPDNWSGYYFEENITLMDVLGEAEMWRQSQRERKEFIEVQ